MASSKMRKWCFTLFDFGEVPFPDESIPSDVRYLIYQVEVCPTTQRRHLQGMFELFKPQRMSWVKKWLGKTVHCETVRDRDAMREYCRKPERVDGPWEHGIWIEADSGSSDLAKSMKQAMEGVPLIQIMKDDPESYCRSKGALKKARSIHFHSLFCDRYKDLDLRPWQTFLEQKLTEEADDRRVYWIVGTTGGEGKTTFGRYLVAKHGAFMVNGGRNEDIVFAYDYEKIVIMDTARCQDVRYDIIEHFKDGILFNQKYESHVMYFKPVHVVILANVFPDYSKISQDRVKIIDISNSPDHYVNVAE